MHLPLIYLLSFFCFIDWYMILDNISPNKHIHETPSAKAIVRSARYGFNTYDITTLIPNVAIPIILQYVISPIPSRVLRKTVAIPNNT